MLQYSFTKGKFEAHFEKQIMKKGKADSITTKSSRLVSVDLLGRKVVLLTHLVLSCLS